MKLKAFAAVLAAGALVAGMILAPGMSAADNRGGGHFGGGHFGGGHFSKGRAGNFRSFGHSNFRGYGGHHFTRFGERNHFRSNRFNRSNKFTGANYPKGNTFGQNKFHNMKTLTSNHQLRQAAFTKQNQFFGNKFGDNNWHHDHDWWQDRNGSWYGYRWYGGVFWPYFFGDYFSFAFWPYDYYDPFWGYGPDVILWGAFWPYGEFYYDDAYAYDGAYAGDVYAPYRRRVAKAQPEASAVAETCAGYAPGVSDLPIQKLQGIIDATENQRAALADLKTAAANASDILKRSCPSEAPLTPVARLDAMEQRLQAMQDANEVVKAPLVHLYSLLTDEQKQRLEAVSRPSSRRQLARAKDVNISELCSNQAGFTRVPADQIASKITLTSAQQQELEKLKAASAKASDELKSSCPPSIPGSLEGRLDAAQQRVTALIQAVDTVRPAVKDFYATLTDEQKAALSIQPAQQNRG
jgi:hypothetical protein